VNEALKLSIPIVAIVDTNSNPVGINYPIPGNDDARRAINLYCELIKQTILDAQKLITKADTEDLKIDIKKEEPKKSELKKEEPKKKELKKEEPKKRELKKAENIKREKTKTVKKISKSILSKVKSLTSKKSK